MTRLRAGFFVVLCAAAACAALAAPVALAGSYVVRACSPTSSPGVWTQVNPVPAGFASGNLCGGLEFGPLEGGAQGSLYAEDVLGSIANIPHGARAGWTFTAPPWAVITAISYYRSLASHVSADLAAGLFLADGTVLEQCRIGLAFHSSIICSMPNDQAPVTFANLGTPGLFFGVICDIVDHASVCRAGGTIHDVQAYLYSARVTVSESVVPTVGNVGGALWAGGLVSGLVPVTFSASDASGIRELAVRADSGQTVVLDAPRCDDTRLVPCPQQPAVTLIVDTTRVADGRRTFSLVVTDAAGNSQVVRSPPVVVDNLGPAAPVGLTATALAGSSAVALSWVDPKDPPAPVSAAMVQVCAMSCLAPVAIGASGAAQVAVPGPDTYSVRLWLLDSAGRGGPHHAAVATVTVASPPPPPLQSGTRTRVSAVLHGRRLRVSGPVAGSGRVRVSWRSKVAGRSVGSGSRTATISDHGLRVAFVIPRRARTAAATIRVVVRRSGRIVGHARARRA